MNTPFVHGHLGLPGSGRSGGSGSGGGGGGSRGGGSGGSRGVAEARGRTRLGMTVRALAAEAFFENLGWHGDLGVRGGSHGGDDGLLGEVRLGAIVLRLRRTLLVAVRVRVVGRVVGGCGARGGRLLWGGRGGGAVGGEGAGNLLLLLVMVWLVMVWRSGGGGGNGRTLLWRGAVQGVRGRRGSLGRRGGGLDAGEIGELNTAHQVLGEPLHDVGGEAMGVCDDVWQVGGEPAGGGWAIVLSWLQRLLGSRLGRGKIRSALLLLLLVLLLAISLRWGGRLLLRLGGWRRLLVVVGRAGGGWGVATLRRVRGGGVGPQRGGLLLRGGV